MNRGSSSQFIPRHIELGPLPIPSRQEHHEQCRLGRSIDVKLAGELFRFIHPDFSESSNIISGKGTLHAPGRWNVMGAFPLSYTAMSSRTANEETLAHVSNYNLPESKALPRVLVAVELRASLVLDLRNGNIRRALRLSESTIRSLDWRKENFQGTEAVTQAWGFSFAQVDRYEAVIVPSAAHRAGTNVLIFPANLQSGSTFRVTTEVTGTSK
jgi:RES domain-containing protein